jgi:poly-beta-1,6-N-acetyl-D-glucosamine synthase
MSNSNKYILLTSALNEESFISRCIESVIKQTVLPIQWVIVDNGSTDNTAKIIKSYVQKYSWITYSFKERINYGISGYHAVPNFYYGLGFIKENDYQYLGNLDADLELDRSDYYEFLLREFGKNSRLGIATGVTYYFDKFGKKIVVWHEPWHTTGGLKFYSRICFDSMEGLVADMGWDGIDEIKAMSRGWISLTYFSLEVNHLAKFRDLERQKGTQYWLNRGRSIYSRGYPLWFIILRSLKVLPEGGIKATYAILKGFITPLVLREVKIINKFDQKFLRSFLISRLFKKVYNPSCKIPFPF